MHILASRSLPKSCHVMPKFHYIYLAQNLLKTRSPTCFEQVSDMSQTSQRPKKVGDLFQTKKVADVYLTPSTWSVRVKGLFISVRDNSKRKKRT